MFDSQNSEIIAHVLAFNAFLFSFFRDNRYDYGQHPSGAIWNPHSRVPEVRFNKSDYE
jgi:hypothetical protein